MHFIYNSMAQLNVNKYHQSLDVTIYITNFSQGIMVNNMKPYTKI